MSKISLIVFLLLFPPGFLLWLYMVGFINYNYVFSEADLENTIKSEVKDSISEKDEIKENKLDLGLKSFYHVEFTTSEGIKGKYENLVKTLDNYIQRYINLFLITSNLSEYKIKDLEEMITIDLEISISGEDLAYLQKYSKTGRESTYLRDLSKLDNIFSNIARLKQRSYVENAFRYSKSFFMGFIFNVMNHPKVFHYLPLLLIFIVACFSYSLFFYKPHIYGGIIINSMIIWDSLNLYWKKLREAEVDIYVKTMQFKELPEDCDPSNMSWYQRLYSFTKGNRCLQYFQNINKNSLEEVSLFKCIIDTYSFYLIQTPAKILGASIRDFTGEIGDLWPWPIKHILSVPLALSFVVIAVFFILILYLKRFRMSVCGATIQIGEDRPSTRPQETAPPIDSLSVGNRDVRKLRPWTKVKFPKRLDRDFGARKRLLLKAIKSSPDTCDNVIQKTSISTILNSQD